jgi:hypothetical protein
MALETEEGIVATHPDAVIDDSHERGTTASDGYFDAICLCIDAVFHKFLYDRCRSLDHLSSGDLTRHFVRQQQNSAHKRV